jgi:hypothetical protein
MPSGEAAGDRLFDRQIAGQDEDAAEVFRRLTRAVNGLEWNTSTPSATGLRKVRARTPIAASRVQRLK